LDSIFDPFKQVHQHVHGLSDGTGLGTSIAQRFVTLLSGDIRVRSKVGEGSVFCIDIPENLMGLDIGPETIKNFQEICRSSKTVLWNGPMGNFEKGFGKQTESLAKVVSRTNAHTIVGGGDTLSSIRKLNLENEFSFISTGGGAMLDFIVDGRLPGIDALTV